MSKKIRLGYDILSKRAIETESGVNIDEALRSISSYQKVPGVGSDNHPDVPRPSTKVLYIVKVASAGQPDTYKEWIWTQPSDGLGYWECTGDTTQDLSGYALKSDMSVVQGTGEDADKTTITLKSGTSATVINAHQDISGKYSKPLEGIPSADMTVAVQGSLGKADTALQNVNINGTPLVKTSGTVDIPLATSSVAGALPAEDKTKLNTVRSLSDSAITIGRYSVLKVHVTKAGYFYVDINAMTDTGFPVPTTIRICIFSPVSPLEARYGNKFTATVLTSKSGYNNNIVYPEVFSTGTEPDDYNIFIGLKELYPDGSKTFYSTIPTIQWKVWRNTAYDDGHSLSYDFFYGFDQAGISSATPLGWDTIDIVDASTANTKPDWNAASGTASEILNKPANLVQDVDYVHTDSNYTAAEKTKLEGIATGAQVNVIEHVNAGQVELVPVNKTVTIPYAAAGVHPSHTVTIGGSTYRTVTMPDGKEWLAENLDYQFAGCTFNPSTWKSKSPSCCYYNGGSTEYKPHYGILYNWYAVEYLTANKATLIPGWHVPTQEEWLTLFTSLQGGIATAGAALKTTTGWSFNGDTSPSRNGTDDYNFSVLPSGVRNFNNAMINEGSNGYFWSSVGFSSTDAYYVEFKSYGYDVDSVVNSTGDKYNGYPLRLVKDTAPDPDIPTTGGLMTPTMVDNLDFADSTLRANVNTRSVLEAYPDPNDSTIIRYRWVPVGTVVV